MPNREYTPEQRASFRDLRKLRSQESLDKDRIRILEINAAKGHPIEVTNTKTNETTIYSSIRQAATNLGIAHTTILRHVKNKKEYKTYKFTLATKKVEIKFLKLKIG